MYLIFDIITSLFFWEVFGIYTEKKTWTTWEYRSEREQKEHWDKQLELIKARKNDNAG